jgi:hypothetical protein
VESRVVPLLLQDANDLRKDRHSIPAAVGGYALGAFGVGIQTYGPKTSKQQDDKHVNQFLADAKEVGATPPKQVVDELRAELSLNADLNKHAKDGKTNRLVYLKAAPILAQHLGMQTQEFTDELAAKTFYQKYRPYLYPNYAKWKRAIDHYREQQVAP